MFGEAVKLQLRGNVRFPSSPFATGSIVMNLKHLINQASSGLAVVLLMLTASGTARAVAPGSPFPGPSIRDSAAGPDAVGLQDAGGSGSTDAVIDPLASIPIIHSLYTLSVDAANNTVVNLYIQRQGKPWSLNASYPTGGRGVPNDTISNLAISPDGRLLCVVNTDSADVSLFSINATKKTLTLVGVSAIGGLTAPESVVVSAKNIAYVVFQNNGNPVLGAFTLSGTGITPLQGFVRNLGAPQTRIEQIAIDPLNQNLAVTALGIFSRSIQVLNLDASGAPSQAFGNPVSNTFGVAFDNSSRLFSAAPGFLTSYSLNGGQFLSAISSLPVGSQLATSRAVVDRGNKFVYTANTQSRTLSRFNSASGALALAKEVAATTSGWPFNMVITPRTSTIPQYLYVNSNGVDMFEVNRVTGDLAFITHIQTVGVDIASIQ